MWIAVREPYVLLAVTMTHRTMVSVRLDPTDLQRSTYKYIHWYILPWIHQAGEELPKMYVDPFSPLLLSLAESIGIYINLDGKIKNNISPWEVYPTFSYGSISQHIHC